MAKRALLVTRWIARHVRSRAIVSTVVALVWLPLLAGCSASQTSNDLGPTSTSSSSSAAPATPDGGEIAPSPSPSDTTHGLLFYKWAPSAATVGTPGIDLSVVDPQTGALRATYSYRPDATELSFPETGSPYPDAAHYFSPDLHWTIAYKTASDAHHIAVAVSNEGQVVDVSSVVDGSDSFSGGLSAIDAFYRDDSLYFTLVEDINSSDGQQYAVPIAALAAGSLTAGDFAKTNIAETADGISSDSNDCATLDGKHYAYSSGVLANGRSLRVIRSAISGTGIQTLGGATTCDGVDALDGKQLLPATTKKLTGAVASPDGETVAFIAATTTDAALYAVSDTGGEPTLIAQLDNDKAVLAEWR